MQLRGWERWGNRGRAPSLRLRLARLLRQRQQAHLLGLELAEALANLTGMPFMRPSDHRRKLRELCTRRGLDWRKHKRQVERERRMVFTYATGRIAHQVGCGA